MEAFLFPFVATTLFLILTESITIRLYNRDSLAFDVNFMIFGVTVKHFEKRKSASKNAKFGNKIAVFNFFTFILKHSEVTLSEFKISTVSTTPYDAAIANGMLYAIFAILYQLLCTYSANLKYDNINFRPTEHTNASMNLDIRITTDLLSLIKGAVLFGFYTFKNSKVKFLYVRNKNE